MSLTLEEKIEYVSERYDPDSICEHLELTSEMLLEAYSELLDENWSKFVDIEDDINESLGEYRDE
jgi:hypothetical protein